VESPGQISEPGYDSHRHDEDSPPQSQDRSGDEASRMSAVRRAAVRDAASAG